MIMKKTKDGRFIEKRVKFPKSFIQNVLYRCKKEKKWTWSFFANYLGISEYTLRYDWLNKGNTVPLSLARKIINLHSNLEWKDIERRIKILDEFWGQRLGKKPKQLEIKITGNKEEKYAEFYGAMLGDGCIFSNMIGICLSGNSALDRNYIEFYLSNIIKEIFGIEPKIYYSKKSKNIRCFVYSKPLAKWLIKEGFPKGKKIKSKITIPSRFLKNPKLIKACIRGLNDTDGSIYHQKNVGIILDISIISSSLLNSVIEAFNKIEFAINHTKNRAYICGEKRVKDYFIKIGSSNLRQILKYKFFLDEGKVPKSKEIETFLRGKSFKEVVLPYHGPVV